MDIFDAVAVASSVPFRRTISGVELREILLQGRVPDDLLPHISRALEELPISMLARVVFAYPQGERATVMRNLTDLADTAGAGARIRAWMTG
jgi:hypothetical protein